MEKLTYANQGYWDRVARAQSWVEKAKAIEEWEDLHGQFIFYWIALNAMYGRARDSRGAEDADLHWFLQRIQSMDRTEGRISDAVQKLKSKTDRLIKDQFLLDPYWREGESPRVKRIIDEDFKRAQKAWRNADLATYLEILLRRLRVLRNQIFHGCSTDRRSLNRNSLLPATEILESLAPELLETLRCHGSRYDWPKIPYPRKDSPQHPKR